MSMLSVPLDEESGHSGSVEPQVPESNLSAFGNASKTSSHVLLAVKATGWKSAKEMCVPLESL